MSAQTLGERGVAIGADCDVGEESESTRRSHVIVFSSLFPHGEQPNAGLFVRERMFRVRDEFGLIVVSPVAWFPFQSILCLFRPGFRPQGARHEVQDGVTVYRPRYLSFPGMLKRLDGLLMALCTVRLVKRLKARHDVVLVDSHFAYPDGYAATLIGRWLNLPVTITMRGTEVRMAANRGLRNLVRAALSRATRVIAVSSSLKSVAVALGIDSGKIRVIGNGVDLGRFVLEPRATCRSQLKIAPDAPVIISVGGLTERKGFHRVIECLPDLVREFPSLIYLVVGGASPEGDWGPRLKAQVERLGLVDHVCFLGALPPSDLKYPLSASDVFVLATSNEGWANVFLEAMACGLPVVTTDVGGNSEVVSQTELGTLVPFGDQEALRIALSESLRRIWDRASIVNYARQNDWNERVRVLKAELRAATGMANLPPNVAADAASMSDIGRCR